MEKHRITGAIFCAAYFFYALALINYYRALSGLPVDLADVTQNPISYGPLAPVEVVASLLVFAGFSQLEVKWDFSRMARNTYLIYLIHAGVLNVINAMTGKGSFENRAEETMAVIVQSAVVYIVSLIMAILYNNGKELVGRRKL